MVRFVAPLFNEQGWVGGEVTRSVLVLKYAVQCMKMSIYKIYYPLVPLASKISTVLLLKPLQVFYLAKWLICKSRPCDDLF